MGVLVVLLPLQPVKAASEAEAARTKAKRSRRLRSWRLRLERPSGRRSRAAKMLPSAVRSRGNSSLAVMVRVERVRVVLCAALLLVKL